MTTLGFANMKPLVRTLILCWLVAFGSTKSLAQGVNTKPRGVASEEAIGGTVRTRDGRNFEGVVHVTEAGSIEVGIPDGPASKIPFVDVASIIMSSPAGKESVVLSINSQGMGSPMDPLERAGVVPAAHWNNFRKKANSGQLLNSDGQASGVTHLFTGLNFDDRTNSIPDRPGDFRMMRGCYDQTDGMTHRIADIPFPRYDVYLYFDRADDENCRSFNHKFWITGAGGGNVLAGPVFGQDKHHANFDGPFIEVPLTSTNDHAQTPAGNYVHFTNLTASTINIMVGDGASSWGERGFSRSTINGLQIVGVASARPGGLTHGIVLRDGNTVSGAIRAADDDAVQFIADHGTEAAVSLRHVARLIFAPVFKDVEKDIPSGKTGALLRGGDFMEGEFSGLNGGKLRMTSVLFGTRNFDLAHQVVAVILATNQFPMGAFRVTTRDGGVLCAQTLAFGTDEVRVQVPNLGVLRFPIGAVAQIERMQNRGGKP